MKCFFAFLVAIFITAGMAQAQEPTAKVQILHNAADPLAGSLDIYLNDELYLDDFQFQTATEFRDFPAGSELRIGIALGTSQSASDIIVNFPYTFAAESRNALVINGVLSPTDFTPNPDTGARPINIAVSRISDLRETGFIQSQVDAVMWHGASDVGAIDIYDGGAAKIVTALPYGYISDYFRVNGGTIPLSVHHKDSARIETYRGDFGNFLGQAVILLYSGFLKPGDNKDGEELGLYLVAAEGGPFHPLPPLSTGERAFVQFVNNAADVEHNAFAIWINDVRVVDTLNFRKATPYIQATPNAEITISVTDVNSSSPSIGHVSKPFTLTSAYHMLVINGLVSTDGYAPNTDPNAQPIGIDLHHSHDLKPGTTPDHVDVFAVNGSTDSPELDFTIIEGPASGPLFDNLSYGSATAYQSLPLEPLKIAVDNSATQQNLGLWQMDCTSYAGKAIAVVTSGFVNPAQNKQGAPMALMLVFDDGQTLILNNSTVGVDETVVEAASNMSISPNPATENITFTCELTTASTIMLSVYDALGARVSQSEMGLQPAGTMRTSVSCSSLASGMYNVVMEAGGFRATTPLWVVR